MPAIEAWSVESRNPRHVALCASRPTRVVWVADGAGAAEPRESLLLWSPGDDAPSVLLPDTRGLGEPALAAFGAGVTVVVPCRSDRGWSIRALRLGDGASSGEALPVIEDVGTPGQVALCALREGLLVVAERWAPDGAISLAGALMEPGGAVAEVALPSRKDEDAFEPALATFDGQRAHLAWLARAGGARELALRVAPVDGTSPTVEVTRAPSDQIGPPAITATGADEIWVAWHTSRRPRRGPELTRWVETRCLSGGRAHVSRGAPLDRRWGVLGEDQGLELPQLFATEHGRPILIVRSAHRIWRSTASSGGWSPLEPLDAAGWGCRSRRPGVGVIDGDLWVARRERHRVVVERHEHDAGLSGRVRLEARDAAPEPSRRGSRAPRFVALDGLPVFFGDIHQHTGRSDGTGTMRESYARARDLYGDDFVAVTDHESFLGKRIGPGEWRRIVSECDRHDEPGRFVTLHGYEWTGARHPGPGHRCVYLPTGELPLLGREHPEATTSADLIAAVGRRGGLVFPHHVGWTGADAAAHDPTVQTCWEVVSCHGAYEALGVGPIGQRDVALEGHFLRDQLDRGLRFGFVGGSDGHGLLWHHGVSRKRDSHRTGLTAVAAAELTREALFEGLRRRRCYATSGVPMLLDLRVEGAPMGAEIAAGATVHVEVRVNALAPIRAVELIGPYGFLRELPVVEPSFDMSLDLTLGGRGGRYLYLRVERWDGEVAWSSPIWLDPA